MDSDENESTVLTRLQSSRHFPAIEGMIAHLRKRGSATVPAMELAYAVDIPKRQIYGIVKLARRYLALTTGESIPNLRNVGYQITNKPRALIFESIKSGDRADAHLKQEGSYFRRVRREALTSPEDVELFVTQTARIALGNARLELSENIAPAVRRLRANAALASIAHADSKTPWKVLGLDDPDDAN